MNDPKYFSPGSPPDYNVTLILVLGICGVSVCGLCSPVALAMGIKALQRMDVDGVHDGIERSLVNVGRILGFISTVFFVAVVLAVLLRLQSRP